MAVPNKEKLSTGLVSMERVAENNY